MQLQINSLAAIERLIGGDSQIEIDLRNNVVQNFTKKYLKELVDNNFINSEVSKLKQQVISAAQDIVGQSIGSLVQKDRWTTKFELKQEVKASLRREAEDTIRAAIKLHVEESVAEILAIYTPEKINSLISSRVSIAVQDEIKQGVKKKLEEFKSAI